MDISYQNVVLVVTCIALLFVLSSPAFASSDWGYPNPLPLDEYSSSLWQVDVGGLYGRAKSDSPDTYAFLVGDSAYVFACPTSATVTYEVTNTYLRQLSEYSNGLYYTYRPSQTYQYINPTVPVFNSLEEGLSSLSVQLGLTASLNYSLPPGNIAFIRLPSAGISYTLRTRMPESVLGANHYPGNNQVITIVNSLPSGGRAPSTPLIPWTQDGPLSVLGLSRNAVYSGINASAGYLCIVNPLYYSGTANGPYEFLSNGSIDITVSHQNGIYVYPLDSTLGFTSGLGISVDTDILNDQYSGIVDPETGEITWTDSFGGSNSPSTGGGNLVDTSETIFDFLRNIGDEFATFLKGPINAIKVVVNSIREFMVSFVQLYQWLPSPVYNLITSALMIAITIGVIKIFV